METADATAVREDSRRTVSAQSSVEVAASTLHGGERSVVTGAPLHTRGSPFHGTLPLIALRI